MCSRLPSGIGAGFEPKIPSDRREESEAIEAFVDDLLSRPAQLHLRLHNSPRLLNRQVLDRLFERVRETMTRNLPQALTMVRSIGEACARILPEVAEPPVVSDRLIVVESVVACIQRQLFYPEKAKKALQRAERRLPGSTGDPRVTAEFLAAKAHFLAEQGHPQMALELLESAGELQKAGGSFGVAGQTLLDQAVILGRHDRLGTAMDKAIEAGSYLDLSGPWGFELLVTLAQLHAAASEVDVARRSLETALSMPSYSPPMSDRLRAASLESRLLLLQGHAELALEAGGRVRAAFLGEGLPYEAVLASLELAQDFLRRTDSVSFNRLRRELSASIVGSGLPDAADAALARLRSAREARDLERIAITIRKFRARQPIPG